MAITFHNFQHRNTSTSIPPNLPTDFKQIWTYFLLLKTISLTQNICLNTVLKLILRLMFLSFLRTENPRLPNHFHCSLSLASSYYVSLLIRWSCFHNRFALICSYVVSKAYLIQLVLYPFCSTNQPRKKIATYSPFNNRWAWMFSYNLAKATQPSSLRLSFTLAFHPNCCLLPDTAINSL